MVTGGSGFFGTNLVERLTNSGHVVRNFDIVPPRNPEQSDRWTPVDVLNREQLVSKTRRFQPQVVIHLAARTDLHERKNLDGYKVNIEGVLNLVDAIRAAGSAERVILASSQLVCAIGYSPKDELDFRPGTLYGRSKVLGERILRAADLGAVWTIVRPTSLWGPWFDTPFRSMFELIAKGRYVHPAGVKAWKQWGFIGNTAFEIERLISARPEVVQGRTFYLADYEPVELHDFVQRVQRALEVRPVRQVPALSLRAAALLGDIAIRIGWSDPPISSFRYRNIVANELQDIAPIREISGPLPYSLDEGIDMTVRWLGDR